VERLRVRHIVESHPGQHICFVRYGVNHPPEQEWIYNTAEIPSQRLIWVRSLGAETDRRIQAAFPGRTAWLVQPDAPLARVEPYPVPLAGR
jgi:hypothetical protein